MAPSQRVPQAAPPPVQTDGQVEDDEVSGDEVQVDLEGIDIVDLFRDLPVAPAARDQLERRLKVLLSKRAKAGSRQAAAEPAATLPVSESFWGCWRAQDNGQLKGLALYQQRKPGSRVVGWIRLGMGFLAKPSRQDPGWLEVSLSGRVCYLRNGSSSTGGVVLERVPFEDVRHLSVQDDFMSQRAADAITALVDVTLLHTRHRPEAQWWRLGSPSQVFAATAPHELLSYIQKPCIILGLEPQGEWVPLADVYGGDLVISSSACTPVEDAYEILRPNADILLPGLLDGVTDMAQRAVEDYKGEAQDEPLHVKEVTGGSLRHRTFVVEEVRERFVLRCDVPAPEKNRFRVPTWLHKRRLTQASQLFEKSGLGPAWCSSGAGWWMEKFAGTQISNDMELGSAAGRLGILLARIHHEIKPVWDDEYRPLLRALVPSLAGLNRGSPQWARLWWEGAERLDDASLDSLDLKSVASRNVVTCHGDFHRENIVSMQGRLRVVDVEHTCVCSAIVDICNGVFECCPTRRAKREFLRSYLEAMRFPAGEAEVDELFEDCKTFREEQAVLSGGSSLRPTLSSLALSGGSDQLSGESIPSVELPEVDFGYDGRPYDTLEARWVALRAWLLENRYGAREFDVVDVCSRPGYLSLQIASLFEESCVISAITAAGSAKGKTRDWIRKLGLLNCSTYYAGWDYGSVKELKDYNGRLNVQPFHMMFLLSVFHHLDEFSKHQYPEEVSPIQGAVLLMANLLCLAEVHFIELSPDRLGHLAQEYDTMVMFLEAAIEKSGKRKSVEEILCYMWPDDQSAREVYVVRDRRTRLFEDLP